MTETGFTYPEVGASQHGPLPSGYRHLHYRTRLGDSGSFARAAEAILTFEMQRATGTGLTASAGRAAPGVRVVVGRGPLRAPCQVVWAVDEPDRAGYGYGTLTGHPASGEESFLVVRDDDGTAWLTITSFSVPAGWSMRLLGPAAPVAQHAYARLCGRALRRLLAKVVP